MTPSENPPHDRTRMVSWEDPALTAAAAAEMSGLDFIRAMASGEVSSPPIARLMGFHVSEVSEGRVVFTVEPGEHHYNPIGAVHGGLACALFDSAMGCAVHTALPAGTGYTTLELKVNFLRPMTSRTGEVHCEGKTIHVGRTTATAEARLTNGEGKLFGHATTTCMVFPGGRIISVGEGPSR
ncbi:PaaI family thioesterase [Rubrobacter indicoceani]|uniref:PaaI family thioesterase n=1 Tax=Rubrobacter indicoceani TaxID=2051957 RepID=UPI000E5BBE20|nr:PaaI family thioesterase [Rubrobacter indicoceani]